MIGPMQTWCLSGYMKDWKVLNSFNWSSKELRSFLQMPMNVPMTICGLVLRGWLQNPNMKKNSVPFKRVSKRVLRRLVRLVVLKTPNPSPREKEKAKKRKGKERIPKGKLRIRVMTRPGKARMMARVTVAQRARRTTPKGLATRTKVIRVFVSFGPKAFVGVEKIAPYKHAWRSSRLRGVCINLTS